MSGKFVSNTTNTILILKLITNNLFVIFIELLIQKQFFFLENDCIPTLTSNDNYLETLQANLTWNTVSSKNCPNSNNKFRHLLFYSKTNDTTPSSFLYLFERKLFKRKKVVGNFSFCF